MTDFKFYTIENTTGKTQELLKGIQKGFGFTPNLFAYMAEAPTTIEAYLALNELVSKTSLTPAQQQIALLAASVENDCDFCTIAHRAIGKMKGADVNTLTAISKKNVVQDPKIQSLVELTQKIVKSRGRPSEKDIELFLSAGFTKQNILEVILIVTIKTLSNYINNLTKPEPNKELLDMV